MSLPYVEKRLSGWGNFPATLCRVYRPQRLSQLQLLLEESRERHWIPWGAGRSYGDAPLNTEHGVIDMTRFDYFVDFDEDEGLLTSEAGVTFEQLLEVFLPRGWFPPVTPGTRFLTLGGALAADIHGKNHHRDGSISRHVESLQLLLPGGQAVNCSRTDRPELFWATLGGMGLTGIILSARLRMRRVRSSRMNVLTCRVPDLDTALETFSEKDPEHQYSVAWVDCLSRGKDLGRSVLMFGDHSPEGPLKAPVRGRLSVPFHFPRLLLNRLTLRAFNSLYFRRHPVESRSLVMDADSFFYPLDFINNWNRLYGRRGFLQYQCVFPLEESRRALVEVLSRLSRGSRGSFLAVLKGFGRQEGLLSFPMPGYTLSLDFPNTGKDLLEFLGELDRLVLERGGRVYLAKDCRLGPGEFRQMYGSFREWLAVKTGIDPENRFSSDLARRLCINS